MPLALLQRTSIGVCVFVTTSCAPEFKEVPTKIDVAKKSMCPENAKESSQIDLLETINISFLTPRNTHYSSEQINELFPTETLKKLSRELNIEFNFVARHQEPQKEKSLQIEIVDFVLKQPGNRISGPKSSDIVFFEYSYSRDNIDIERYSYPVNLLSSSFMEECNRELDCNYFPSETERPVGRFDPRFAGFIVRQNNGSSKSYCFIKHPKNIGVENQISEYTLKVTECIFRSIGDPVFMNGDEKINFFSPRGSLKSISNQESFDQAFGNTTLCFSERI